MIGYIVLIFSTYYFIQFYYSIFDAIHENYSIIQLIFAFRQKYYVLPHLFMKFVETTVITWLVKFYKNIW